MSGLSRSEQRQLTAAVKASMTSKSSSASKKGKGVRMNTHRTRVFSEFHFNVMVISLNAGSQASESKTSKKSTVAKKRPRKAQSSSSGSSSGSSSNEVVFVSALQNSLFLCSPP
jgi:hypothetical protein